MPLFAEGTAVKSAESVGRNGRHLRANGSGAAIAAPNRVPPSRRNFLLVFFVIDITPGSRSSRLFDTFAFDDCYVPVDRQACKFFKSVARWRPVNFQLVDLRI